MPNRSDAPDQHSGHSWVFQPELWQFRFLAGLIGLATFAAVIGVSVWAFGITLGE